MVNKVILVGNLGADPEIRSTQGGDTVCSLSVATSEKWQDKRGDPKEHTEWHKIVVWGKQAEACAKYLAKGRQVYVEGKIRTEKWTDQSGTDRWTTKIIADTVRFLGSTVGDTGRSNAGRDDERPRGGNAGGRREQSPSLDDDDIPF